MSTPDFRKVERAMVEWLKSDGAPIEPVNGEWFLDGEVRNPMEPGAPGYSFSINLSALAQYIAEEALS